MSFPCIRQFHFVSFFMERNIIYKHIVEYAQKTPSDKSPVVLDLGCCMGTDLRKLLQDGYPANSTSTNVYGCELLPEFITEGHKLYRDGPDSKKPTPIKFFSDDIFNVPVKADGAVAESGSFGLNNLRGKIDILYAGALFHLFEEEKQFALAQRLVALINAKFSADRNNTEAIIFGRHIGSLEAHKAHRPSEFGGAFGHSPESWKEMWETILVQTFGQGVLKHVEIDVLKEDLIPDSKNVFHHAWLWWSVTLRLPL
ncbi:hypothetical protein BYT27DRAFT_7091067 [Phlegmacium glaucopus]|nr:hypothetical protein BYT27DRAFT_7091067 [Phlegmacium glaucopus]